MKPTAEEAAELQRRKKLYNRRYYEKVRRAAGLMAQPTKAEQAAIEQKRKAADSGREELARRGRGRPPRAF